MKSKEVNRFSGRSWYLQGSFPSGLNYTEMQRLFDEISRKGKVSLHSPHWMHTSRLFSLKRVEQVVKIMLEHGVIDVIVDEKVTDTKRLEYTL